MGTALIAGLLETGKYEKEEISASDVSAERRLYISKSYGIKCFSSNKETVRNSDILIIAVEPKHMKEVLEDIRDAISDQVVVSIAAGIPLVFLEKYLEKQIPIFRAMPNSPCLVGEGAIALASQKDISDNKVEVVKEIFTSIGKVFVLDEQLFDAVTGLSGSGPAYIYHVMEGLIEGGVKAGLSEDLALTLVAQTVLGAGKMVIETKLHPSKLREKVATPGGTTVEGLKELYKIDVKALFSRAVERAAKRSHELANRVKYGISETETN